MGGTGRRGRVEFSTNKCGKFNARWAQFFRRKYQRMPDFSKAPATTTAAKATNPVIELSAFSLFDGVQDRPFDLGETSLLGDLVAGPVAYIERGDHLRAQGLHLRGPDVESELGNRPRASVEGPADAGSVRDQSGCL